MRAIERGLVGALWVLGSAACSNEITLEDGRGGATSTSGAVTVTQGLAASTVTSACTSAQSSTSTGGGPLGDDEIVATALLEPKRIAVLGDQVYVTEW